MPNLSASTSKAFVHLRFFSPVIDFPPRQSWVTKRKRKSARHRRAAKRMTHAHRVIRSRTATRGEWKEPRANPKWNWTKRSWETLPGSFVGSGTRSTCLPDSFEDGEQVRVAQVSQENEDALPERGRGSSEAVKFVTKKKLDGPHYFDATVSPDRTSGRKTTAALYLGRKKFSSHTPGELTTGFSQPMYSLPLCMQPISLLTDSHRCSQAQFKSSRQLLSELQLSMRSSV